MRRRALWLLTGSTFALLGCVAPRPPEAAPAVGEAYYRTSQLLWAVRDGLLSATFARDPFSDPRLEPTERAGRDADAIAYELGYAPPEAAFRGPGSWVPADPHEAARAGEAALSALRALPTEQRRTPRPFAHRWNKLNANVRELQVAEDAALAACLSLSLKILVELAPATATLPQPAAATSD